jgi:shikimate kinase
LSDEVDQSLPDLLIIVRLSGQTERRTKKAKSAGKKLSRLVLTGFMGAGKSTVGALLAQMLGWRFLDLDCLIEADCLKTVADIFRDHGEAYFRSKEREAIQNLQREIKVVIALGGGAVEDPSSLALLVSSGETCLVFLDAPLPELLSRISGGSKTRPLLTTPEELKERHQRRLPLYRAAHLSLLTTGLSPRQVADGVLEGVDRDWLIEGRVTETHE